MIPASVPIVGQALLTGFLPPLATDSPDCWAASFVLVVGGDVADAGVQPAGVVVHLDDGQLGSEDGGVGDGHQVRVVVLDGLVQRLDPGLIGRCRDLPKCWAIATMAMNALELPPII